MQFSRIKNLLLKMCVVFIFITIINYAITGYVKNKYISLNNNLEKDSVLNEEFYKIDNSKGTFTANFLVNDINHVEVALLREFEASSTDVDLQIEYYKKLFHIFDTKLLSIYNELYNKMNNEKNKESIYQYYYIFKIDRINKADEVRNGIIDPKEKLIEYYKSLSSNTKAKCLEIVDKYSTFLDK